jgi:recombination protein RecA
MNKQELKGAVIGMVIGDGSLALPATSKNGISRHGASKNARLSVAHAEKSLDYLNWKRKMLEEITSVRMDDYIGGFNQTKTIRISSMCHPFYTKLWERLYYNGRKTLDEHCLKMLTDIGLAIIYMDDGSYSSNGSVELNKNNFNYAEHLMLQKCFKLKWDLNWNIHRKTQYYRLYLKHKDNSRFFDIVSPMINQIPSMRYKIQGAVQPN